MFYKHRTEVEPQIIEFSRVYTEDNTEDNTGTAHSHAPSENKHKMTSFNSFLVIPTDSESPRSFQICNNITKILSVTKVTCSSQWTRRTTRVLPTPTHLQKNKHKMMSFNSFLVISTDSESPNQGLSESIIKSRKYCL